MACSSAGRQARVPLCRAATVSAMKMLTLGTARPTPVPERALKTNTMAGLAACLDRPNVFIERVVNDDAGAWADRKRSGPGRGLRIALWWWW